MNFPGLYKPAVPDQRQDTTARTLRVKNSGSDISSPPYLLPYTKPFSGRPTGSSMTSPTREAGESSKVEVWDCLPPVAARPSPRHQRCSICRPSRTSRCSTPGTTSYDCGDWRYQPASDTPFSEENAHPGSPPESVAVTALQECISLPSTHRLKGIGVIKITSLV